MRKTVGKAIAMLRHMGVVVALVLFGAAACNRSEPYQLGVALDRDDIAGVRLASLELTTRNGIDGRKLLIRLMERDTGDMPAQAPVDTARSWAQDTLVRAALGHSHRETALAALSAMGSGNLPYIVTTISLSDSVPHNPFAFRLAPDYEVEAATMVEQAKKLGAGAKAVIIYPEDPAGLGLQRALHAQLSEAGVPIAYEGAYREGVTETQLLTMVVEAIDTNPAVVFWLGGAGELVPVMPTLRGRAPNALLIASHVVEVGEVYYNPEGTFTGLRFVRMANLEDSSPHVENFRVRYYTWSGRPATSGAAVAYDATQLVGEGLRSGARTREQLREYLASIGRTRPAYNGVSGPIAFDERGRSFRTLQIAEVVDGGVRVAPEVRPVARR